jgi:hypothetical protein
LPITTTFSIFHETGKKHREMQAFRITRRNGFINGRLKSKRSADKPSGPGADLEFKECAAVSSS